jgi:hypothetical protein
MGILFKLRSKRETQLGAGLSGTRHQSSGHEFTARLKGVVMKAQLHTRAWWLQDPGAFSTDSHDC